MSTFDGYMPEFPDIQVDYFRRSQVLRPPLACFLSHVHTDHLAGLESFKSPFLYCSAATKELLLRLERYPLRMNIAQGILVPRKQHYKHLQNLLKPIPLETPTCIELEPGNEIQVTLFDANHCTGAVMFLIENDSFAILYTGDIRSEPWFVNALVRNPFLIQYTSGIKRLDCIYLDTSNTGPTHFPTKAEGLKELLEKVLKYPSDTVFHFTAWTFGYEEVWMALSRALNSQIHVDGYKLKLYQSLRGNSTDLNDAQFLTNDGRVLTGYQCGNTSQIGCLTSDIDVRMHSCEKGLHCEKVDSKTVFIRPIVARNKYGREVGELDIGGGGGDLTRRPELELDNPFVIDDIFSLFGNTDEFIMQDIKRMILDGNRSSMKSLSLDDMGLDRHNFSLEDLLDALIKTAYVRKESDMYPESSQGDCGLPKVITFPYSRHSSYEELCHLVEIFDPRDVYPCTVDEKTWDEDVSMHALFSNCCSAARFRHDEEMRRKLSSRESQHDSLQAQTTERTISSQMLPPSSPLRRTVVNAGRRIMRIYTERQTQANLHPNYAGHNIDAENLITATPPQEIFAESPGSASQSMRRKAIEEGITGAPMKRARLQLDSTDEGFLAGSSQLAGHSSPTLSFQDEVIEGFLGTDDEADFREQTIWDRTDAIHRCSKCQHEVWPLFGSCTNCGEGPTLIPYYESFGSDGIPNYIPNRRLEPGEALTGCALDCNSSAYDSQDEDIQFLEEYEINSFIDDEERPESPEGEDDGSSSDGATDYKKQCLSLQAELVAMRKENEELKASVEDVNSNPNKSDSEDLGELENGSDDNSLLVLVDANDVDADPESSVRWMGGRRWYDDEISANHTFPEIEL